MNHLLTKEDQLLLNEAGLSSICIGQGLTILKKANFVKKENYYQAFFLLTIGIERLLKIIIITKYRADNNGTFPKDSDLKKLGHDIKKQIKIIEEYNFDKNEGEFITDEIQLDIIDFFTTFAKGSRYYNIDALAGSPTQNDPLSDWKKIQNKIKEKEGLVSQPLPQEFNDFVNSFTTIMHHDEDGSLVTDAERFYRDRDILERIQGMSVFHVWKIIQILADKLRFLEYNHNLFPFLREFFPYFIKDWDKEIDVLTWDDWNHLE